MARRFRVRVTTLGTATFRSSRAIPSRGGGGCLVGCGFDVDVDKAKARASALMSSIDRLGGGGSVGLGFVLVFLVALILMFQK